MTTDAHSRAAHIRLALWEAYTGAGLWGEGIAPLPEGMTRGSDPHLALLTLVYTISGTRKLGELWETAVATYQADPALFDPHTLAPANPKDLQPRLSAHGLLRNPTSQATTWQRIGKAIVMRGQGSVSKILADHSFDAPQLMAYLQRSKSTFPVLSGAQTAPRWLAGLALHGEQPIKGLNELILPVEKAGEMVLNNLEVDTARITAPMFDIVKALGERGCRQRNKDESPCPVAAACPVARFCLYG